VNAAAASDLPIPESAARDAPVRHLRIPGTRNLRDVGGYPAGPGRRTRWRTLFRTDALDRLPDRSVERLVSLGVRQVIDLRWPHELAAAPSAFVDHPEVAYRSIPLFEYGLPEAIGIAGSYRHALDARGDQLVAIARALAAPGGTPAIVGCTAGKDRTGVVIALLLAAAGVAPEVIADDYALTAELFASPVEDEHLVDWRAGPIELECRPEYVLAALDHLDRCHGGAARLLLAAGLSEVELAALVERLTEPAEAPPS
jgi:protein-tyrosine phosphatase